MSPKGSLLLMRLEDLYIDSIGGDVLGQLSSMRKKLESERRRVENQLENQRVGVHEVLMTNFQPALNHTWRHMSRVMR